MLIVETSLLLLFFIWVYYVSVEADKYPRYGRYVSLRLHHTSYNLSGILNIIFIPFHLTWYNTCSIGSIINYFMSHYHWRHTGLFLPDLVIVEIRVNMLRKIVRVAKNLLCWDLIYIYNVTSKKGLDCIDVEKSIY